MKITSRDLAWLIRDKYPGLFSAQNWRPMFRALQKDAARLRKGEPLAYVIGWAPFLSAKIDLRFRPLIPRVETEHWTEAAIRELSARRGSVRALDIFCGSGCIGIALLLALPRAHVTFADKDPAALRQVRLNLKLNNIPARRYRVVRSDVFRGIPGKFDVIFANPPYIPSARKLPAAVSGFEPRTALFAGRDGFALIRKFLNDLPSRLETGAQAFLEFDISQGRRMSGVAQGYGLKATVRKDQFGRLRWAKLVYGGAQRSP
jgi:release factor glutamine methyltransferase